MIGDDEEGDDSGPTAVANTVKKVLVSADVAALLGKAGDGSLGKALTLYDNSYGIWRNRLKAFRTKCEDIYVASFQTYRELAVIIVELDE